jgi:quercetin dioxygenase-like cupin family protein
MSGKVTAFKWDEIPSKQVRPGITMRGFRGDKVLVTYNILEPGLTPGPHSHPFDQIFMILKGKVKLHIEDQVFECGPGSVVRIPPNAVHWAEGPSPEDGPAINMDIFGPAREDYLHLVTYQTDEFSKAP